MGKNRKSVKKGGVQSVENAAKILRLLGSAPGPLMLKELARAADNLPSRRSSSPFKASTRAK